MSAYGTKVVAVLDTQSTFGITIKQLKENVETLQNAFSTLTSLAPGDLDTLQEIGSAITSFGVSPARARPFLRQSPWIGRVT